MTNYPNCRFGVSGHDVIGYDAFSLNVGWYVDWSIQVSPATPGGMEFVQMVRLRQVGLTGWGFAKGQNLSGLLSAIDANPGVVWLVGNEPDSPAQDEMLPEVYASAYHDVYAIIKGRDPTARVGVGGIVQPTPLRLAYLDTVWDTYYQTYAEPMPVDVWNIHSFILRETVVEPDPDPCHPTIPIWGAYIPPGSTAQSGELYCIRDQDNLDIFWQRIRDFRRWMAEKGERNKPLIITEYGVLFYEDFHDEDGNTYSQERVGRYMTSTFDLMLNETDALLGYPYDGNRLVQRWAWFSLSEDPDQWGGTLFDPATHTLRLLGQTFRGYTTAITPTVDLLAARAYAEPLVFWYQGQPVTATLKAVVSNIGNLALTEPIVVTFYNGPPGEVGTQPIGSAQTLDAGLQGCADYAVVSVSWPGLSEGAHPFYVQVDGPGAITEADETNNLASGVVLVAVERLFLPTVAKGVN